MSTTASRHATNAQMAGPRRPRNRADARRLRFNAYDGHTGDRALAPPQPPPNSIERPQLLRRLHDSPIVVLCAPAGYGKTTLLAQWAAHQRRPLAWLALSQHTRHLDIDLDRFAHAHAAAGRPAVLVIDELEHLNGDPRSARTLAALAHRPPPSLQLVLSSRHALPFGLSRLRAAQRVVQLGARDLEMSASETHRLLHASGAPLDERSAAELAEHTQGWPVAIRLAADPSALRRDRAENVGLSPGAGRAIAQYIREELIAPLDPGALRLLMCAALLDHGHNNDNKHPLLGGDACDAVLQREGSAEALRALAAAGTTLTAQDAAETSFRFHPLVRDALRAELSARAARELPGLHRRASEWFAATGRNEPAVEHACATGDAPRAGALLWDGAQRLLYGRDEQIQRWLSSLTSAHIASDARLTLVAAHSSIALEDAATARHWLRLHTATQPPAAHPPRSPTLAAARALLDSALGDGGIGQVAASAAHAQALLDDRHAMRPLADLLHGVALHLSEGTRHDTREDARHELSHAAEQAGAMPIVRVLSLAQLALILIDDNDDPQQAEQLAASACACAREHRLHTRPVSALAYATAAFAHGRRGAADEAKRELVRAQTLFASLGDFMPWLSVETGIVMARASILLADVTGARALLSHASSPARRPVPFPRFLAWLDDGWCEIDELGARASSGAAGLTIAELRVLRFLPTHLSFREIGARLHVSNNTVKTQAHSIYFKLDAASRTEAVANASAIGLIEATVV